MLSIRLADMVSARAQEPGFEREGGVLLLVLNFAAMILPHRRKVALNVLPKELISVAILETSRFVASYACNRVPMQPGVPHHHLKGVSMCEDVVASYPAFRS